MNTLLKDWGLKINSDKERKTYRDNGKVKAKYNNYYSIKYIDNFNDFI